MRVDQIAALFQNEPFGLAITLLLFGLAGVSALLAGIIGAYTLKEKVQERRRGAASSGRYEQRLQRLS
jgi:hypothetical protein